MPRPFCLFLAVAMYFCFIATFAWMTVMAFDICCAFRKLPSSDNLCRQQSRLSHNRRRFLSYCCFAFGLPLVLAAVAVAVDVAPSKDPFLIKPNFGMMSCWFHGKHQYLNRYS